MMGRKTHPSWDQLIEWERGIWQLGKMRVAGVDEVGRGPVAGPVVAAAVVLVPGGRIEGLDDSKRLSESQRLNLLPIIMDQAAAISLGFVGPEQIERMNILEASRRAMGLALGRLPEVPDVVLTDAMEVSGPWQEWCLLHGDGRCASIAAASVVAKIARDRYMEELSEQYPEYGFGSHKGYATRLHRAAVLEFGACPAHRLSFVRHWLSRSSVN